MIPHRLNSMIYFQNYPYQWQYRVKKFLLLKLPSTHTTFFTKAVYRFCKSALKKCSFKKGDV
jgi:hypothetical protein